MSFENRSGLRKYTFPGLQDTGVVQGIFCRSGGVSPEPWRSLNLGGTVGDARQNVIENRRLIFEDIKRPVESIYDAWQVHGTDVIYAETPRLLDQPHLKADILLTDRPEITLMMRFADCVPVFLVDPVRRVVGMVHAGWKGTVQSAAARAVRAMQERYDSKPEDIRAGIGPSICVRHYPVGREVIDAVQTAFGDKASSLLPPGPAGTHFDLWAANMLSLKQAGVKHVEVSGVCTFEHLHDWFSHRGEHGKTGRFGAVLALGEGHNGHRPGD